MLGNIRWDLWSIGFAIALATTGGSWADETNVRGEGSSVRQAVATLNQSPAWRHLDATWIESVTAEPADGPEMNVDVCVVTTDGQAVAGAVVAIQESIDEAYPRVSLVSEPFQPIRAVDVTDEGGSCRFEAVSTTPPPAGRYGRIKTFVVIAHPSHGFEFYPLLRTSRNQVATVMMSERVSMPVVADKVSQARELRITRFASRAQHRSSANGFATDPLLSPRAIIDDRGLGVFMNLPKGRFVSLEAHYGEGWQMVNLQSLVPTDSASVQIPAEEPAARLPIRFFDSLTQRPVANVSVDRWRHPDQTSGDDGLVVIKPAFPERVLRVGQIEKRRFTIEPPATWVRESVWEYPHRIASPPQPYRLTRATVVRGRVVDATTGDGIEGVVVQSRRPNPTLGGVSSEFHAVATSDETGSFELSAPPGRQTVSIAAPVTGCLLPAEQRLSVVMGKPLQGLILQLKPAEPIRGRVVDQDGKAVAGVEVICHSANRAMNYRGGLPLDATIVAGRTHDDGAFAIDRPPGQYDSLMLKAMADDRQSRDAIIDFDPKSNRPIDIDLELSLGQPARTVELSGVVLKDGKPWAGTSITVDPPVAWGHRGTTLHGGVVQRGSAQLGETTTDEQGHYHLQVEVNAFPHLRIGVRSTPTARPTSAALVKLGGRRIEVPPIEIRDKTGDMTIRGIVMDPQGLPVAGAHVRAMRQRPNIRRPQLPNGDQPHHATTDARGQFLLRELYAGPVDIQVLPAGVPSEYARSSYLSLSAGDPNALIILDPSLSRVPERIEPVRSLPLDEPKEASFGRDTTHPLDHRRRIRGLVVDRNDTPVAGATVRVFCVTPADSLSKNNPLAHPACQLVAQTNSQGQFSIGPFPADANVRLAAGAEGLSARVTDFLSLADKDGIAQITLSRLDPDLPAMKTTHQLIDAKGAPVPMAIVTTAYQEYADILKFSSDLGPCVLTDAKGNFRFPTIAGVDYLTVGVFPISGGAAVIENNYSHRKYRLANSMSIRGRIVDENGAPIAALNLVVHNNRTPGQIRVASAADGTFRIDNLTGGDECSLSGASAPQPKFFLCKRQFASVGGQVLDFGDLIAKRAATLTVKLVPSPGKELPAGSSVKIGSQSVNVTPQGTAVFAAVSPESVLMQVNNGQVTVVRTDPPLQQTLAGPFGNKITFVINTANTDTVTVYVK